MVVNQQEKNWYFFKSLNFFLNVWLLMLQPTLGLKSIPKDDILKCLFQPQKKQKIIDV